MKRVLVIEDDPLYRSMVVQALAEDGFDVYTAENGQEGIDKARTYTPDLVISDVVMEKADGYQVLATLRADPLTAAIPCIMITGWSSKGGQRHGMTLGADDYLSKPFNATELLSSVSAQIRKSERRADRAKTSASRAGFGFGVQLPSEIEKPLRTVIGLSKTLDERHATLEREQIGTMARHLHSSAFRIRRIVENVTLYNQLFLLEDDPSAHAAARAEKTEGVKDVVEQRAIELAGFRGRDQDLVLKLSDGTVYMSAYYLQRIVDELVDNAFKFSPPGRPVEVMTAFSADRFGIAVTDQGVGMSPDEASRVDAFVRFGVDQYQHNGAGLGLAIVRRIAFLHGGGLSIKSKEGVKTRVAVEIARNT